MKKLLIISLSMMFSLIGFSQSIDRQVISSGGNTTSAGNYIVSATIGETVIGTSTAGDFMINQGFQHANFNTTEIIEEEPIAVKYKMYPNPVSSILTINFTTEKNVEFNIGIYDVTGKNVFAEDIEISQFTYNFQTDVSNYMPGTYLVKIVEKSGEIVQTLKFVKK